MLDAHATLYPMFATHNAHTASAIVEYAAERSLLYSGFEFQRLHGMGEVLYDEIVPSDKLGIACRVYAPVGSHQDLLPYLVRRLLENGANTSFVNRIADASIPVEEIVADPVARARAQGGTPSPLLPLPRDLFNRNARTRAERVADQPEMAALDAAFAASAQKRWTATPLIAAQRWGQRARGRRSRRSSPDDRQRCRGGHIACRSGDRPRDRRATGVGRCRRRRARRRARPGSRHDRGRHATVVVLLAREAGKARADAIGEVRGPRTSVAITPLARQHFARPLTLPSPTGESNELALHGRGASRASARGISRCRSSPVRSPPRSPRATRSSPNRPSRPR